MAFHLDNNFSVQTCRNACPIPQKRTNYGIVGQVDAKIQLIQELQAINETNCAKAANQALEGGEVQFHELIYVCCLRIHIYAR